MPSSSSSPWGTQVATGRSDAASESTQFPSLAAASQVQISRAARARRPGAFLNPYTSREEQLRQQALVSGQTLLPLDSRSVSNTRNGSFTNDEGNDVADEAEEPSEAVICQSGSTISSASHAPRRAQDHSSMSLSFADSPTMAAFGGAAATRVGPNKIYARHNLSYVQARKRFHSPSGPEALLTTMDEPTLKDDGIVELERFLTIESAQLTPMTAPTLRNLVRDMDRASRAHSATMRALQEQPEFTEPRQLEILSSACKSICQSLESSRLDLTRSCAALTVSCRPRLSSLHSDPSMLHHAKPSSDFIAFAELLDTLNSLRTGEQGSAISLAVLEATTEALLRLATIFIAASTRYDQTSAEILIISAFAAQAAFKLSIAAEHRSQIVNAMATLVAQPRKASARFLSEVFVQLLRLQPALEEDIKPAVLEDIDRHMSLEQPHRKHTVDTSPVMSPTLAKLLHVLRLIREARPLAHRRSEGDYLLALDAAPFLSDFAAWAIARGSSQSVDVMTPPAFICDVPYFLTFGAKLRMLSVAIERERQVAKQARLSRPYDTALHTPETLHLKVVRRQVEEGSHHGLANAQYLQDFDVSFVGEDGVGIGLMREWATILSDLLFRPSSEGGVLALPPSDEILAGGHAHISLDAAIDRCLLAGKLLALSAVHGIVLGPKTRVSFALLQYGIQAEKGKDLDSLASVRPLLASGLQDLLALQDASEIDDLYDGWTFEWDGVPLPTDSDHMSQALTYQNRHTFVRAVSEHLLALQSPQMLAIRAGTQAILGPSSSLPSLALSFFSGQELQRMLFGDSFQKLDVDALRRHARHEGINLAEPRDHVLIEAFWDHWKHLDLQAARRLLSYITGCKVVPVLEGSVQLIITLVGTWSTGELRLPSASTCQSRLFLSRCEAADMKRMLDTAVRECDGFWLR